MAMSYKTIIIIHMITIFINNMYIIKYIITTTIYTFIFLVSIHKCELVYL